MYFKKVKQKCYGWLKIIRIQFYPMTWVAYSMGAAIACLSSQEFNSNVYWLGYATLFLIELCTVLTNEYHDFNTDRINKNASPFTGGSRVLVEGKLSFKTIRTAICVTLFLALGSGYILTKTPSNIGASLVVVLLLSGLLLGLGYTIPPLKFSYRGFGEVVVGITHSPYVILCGYAFQSGTLKHPLPWLLSIPLLFATLAAITLAGIPDIAADRTVSKKTFSVIWGARRATMISMWFVVIAALSVVLLWHSKVINGSLGVAMWVVISHALVLSVALSKLMKSNNYDRTINGIMVLALSYIFWFGFIPLLSLITG